MNRVSGATGVVVIGLIGVLLPVVEGQAQKKVKDQGEYDLYNSILTEKDAQKKFQLLNTWTEKYPDTEFQDERLNLYNTVNHPEKVVEMGNALLGKDPKNLTALYLITSNISKLTRPTPEQFAIGEKAAQSLLDNLDALKPASASDADWKTAKAQLQGAAQATLLYITTQPAVQAAQKKDYEGAEREYRKALEKYPNSGDIAYALGSVLIAEKKQDKSMAAFFYIARAVALDPASGGLADPTRKQVEAYLEKIYNSFHGPDPAGLQQLKEMAKAQPNPPADFKIESKEAIALQKQQEDAAKDPAGTLWKTLKEALVAANGEQFFESNMKGAKVPGGVNGVQKLKGTVVSGTVKELKVAVSDPATVEVTLKLETPLKGKPEAGSPLEFEGVPESFAKDPFMVTFADAKVTGVKVQAPPPRPRPGTKKSAGSKKG